jgi:hypothetical protein
MESNHFRIANLDITIRFADTSVNSMTLLPSFIPFRQEEEAAKPLFTLTVDDSTRPVKQKSLVKDFDTGNGHTLVYQLEQGGYQYIIRDLNGSNCCLLICNDDFSNCQCALNGNWCMRTFGLNNALMLVFAFAGAAKGALLVHASTIMKGDYGYPFIAESGTGKSTHTSLWLRFIDDCSLMNDDNPVIRIEDGTPYIYGSPWSGKTPCYRNVRALLGAVTRIERAPKNSIERLPVVKAFASVLPSCSTMMWDKSIYDHVCNAVTRIIETTPVYTLHCLPDAEAAQICHQTIAR